MALPKKADCSDCLEFLDVVWTRTSHGLEALCAGCRAMRETTMRRIRLTCRAEETRE